MLVGYKTWANPDTDAPWLANHLVGLSESLSHPGDNYLTRHCSLCPSPPSCHANRSQSVKCHSSLAGICAQLLPPPHCLLPMLPLLPVLMLLGHWNKGLGLLFLMGTAGFWEAHRVYFLIRSSHCGLGRDCCFSPRHFINYKRIYMKTSGYGQICVCIHCWRSRPWLVWLWAQEGSLVLLLHDISFSESSGDCSAL